MQINCAIHSVTRLLFGSYFATHYTDLVCHTACSAGDEEVLSLWHGKVAHFSSQD